MVTPDLAGFVDAQQRLRDAFGEQITFLAEPSVTFPPGTPTDPETGKPYDPVIAATGSAQASAAVKCDVVFRAVNRAGVTGGETFEAIGITDATHIMLIADISARTTIESCVDFDCRGERFKITAQKPDGVGGVQRWLIYGRRR